MARRPAGARLSAPIHALGSTILVLGVAHVLVDDDPLGPEVVESAILIAFAAAVFWVGYRAAVDGLSADDVLRLLTLSLGSGIVVGVLAAVFVVARMVSDEPTPEWGFVLSIGWSIGVAGGALVAYYVGRVRRSV